MSRTLKPQDLGDNPHDIFYNLLKLTDARIEKWLKIMKIRV